MNVASWLVAGTIVTSPMRPGSPGLHAMTKPSASGGMLEVVAERDASSPV
jgi:hypothetical protein